MKWLLTLLAAVVPLCSSCGLLYYGLSTTGAHHAEGTIIDCGAFTFRVPKPNYRVTPNRFGPNSLMAYQDFGPGASRQKLFTVTETDGFQSDRFGEEMMRMEKSHLKFWNEAVQIRGDYRNGKVFHGIIPKISRKTGNAEFISRETIGFIGQVKDIGGRKYLILLIDTFSSSTADVPQKDWFRDWMPTYSQLVNNVREN